ncbi:MAG: acetate--CoA ligase family protein [Candidatus Helarchaeota archaeon]
MENNIKYFFKPKSIAIFGASDKNFTWGNWVGTNLLSYKSQGNVYIINPNHDHVLGEKTFKKVADLPEDVDLAMIIVPAPKVIPTLEECAAKNAKAATIISAGFSETIEGKKLREELKHVVKETGIRLQGPNCAGFYNLATNINACPLPPRFLKESPIAFVTQSGFIGNTLTIWGRRRNLTFGKYISVGNEADLTVTDYLEYFSEDPTTQVIMLYLEGLHQGRRFFNVAKKVAKEKPIVVWKTSETSAVRRAALSHTAHLVGSKQVFDGLIKQAGMLRVRRLEHGVTLSHAFLRHPPLQGKRLAIMMFGAGWGILLTDALSNAGFEVPRFSFELEARLKDVLSCYRASVKNPIDFGAADTMDFSLMIKITKILFESGEVDGFIIANIGEYSPFDELGEIFEMQVARSLNRIEKKLQKPVFLFSLLTVADSQSITKIKKKMNVYHSMDELIETLNGLWTHFQWRAGH